MTRVYVIRHGENYANVIKQLSSRIVDYSITEKGELQAHQTGEALERKGIEALFCSPMKRTRETAAIIGSYLNLTPQVIEELREINVGDLEKVRSTLAIWDEHDSIIRRWQNGEHALSFPGGEDYNSLLGRARTSLKKATAGRENSTIAIVGHLGMFNFTLNDLCTNVNTGSMLDRGTNNNCSITQLEVECVDGTLDVRLIQWANSDHIHGEAADFVSTWPEEGDL